MKQPHLSRCAYVLPDGIQCKARAWKPGEKYCIRHDIAAVIAASVLSVHTLTVNKSGLRRYNSTVQIQ